MFTCLKIEGYFGNKLYFRFRVDTHERDLELSEVTLK